jgi:hypothetical protein
MRLEATTITNDRSGPRLEEDQYEEDQYDSHALDG